MAAAHPKLISLLNRLQEMVAPMCSHIGDGRLSWMKTLPAVHLGDGFAVVHASQKSMARDDGRCHR
ncbi:MAG: hypothetical protein DMG49_20490 [Acidobacteria bacterium]|nr:MAG: hypothetical protein DMG49_20490 [Acidobacteriota bacterium]